MTLGDTVAAVTQGALNRTKTTATGSVLTSGTIPYSTPTQVTITARDTYGNLDIAGGQQGRQSPARVLKPYRRQLLTITFAL